MKSVKVLMVILVVMCCVLNNNVFVYAQSNNVAQQENCQLDKNTKILSENYEKKIKQDWKYLWKEKDAKIGRTSFNTDEYNILFQRYTTDAMIKAKSQVRIYIDKVSSMGRTDALVRVIFQVIVNNNEMMIETPISKNDKRDVAIMQTIVETLNGVKLDKTKSQIFINNDIDRFAGAEQVSYNNNYSRLLHFLYLLDNHHINQSSLGHI